MPRIDTISWSNPAGRAASLEIGSRWCFGSRSFFFRGVLTRSVAWSCSPEMLPDPLSYSGYLCLSLAVIKGLNEGKGIQASDTGQRCRVALKQFCSFPPFMALVHGLSIPGEVQSGCSMDMKIRSFRNLPGLQLWALTQQYSTFN